MFRNASEFSHTNDLSSVLHDVCSMFSICFKTCYYATCRNKMNYWIRYRILYLLGHAICRVKNECLSDSQSFRISRKTEIIYLFILYVSFRKAKRCISNEKTRNINNHSTLLYVFLIGSYQRLVFFEVDETFNKSWTPKTKEQRPWSRYTKNTFLLKVSHKSLIVEDECLLKIIYSITLNAFRKSFQIYWCLLL